MGSPGQGGSTVTDTRTLRIWTIYVCAGCGRHEADRCDSSCKEYQRGQEQRWEKVEVMEVRR